MSTICERHYKHMYMYIKFSTALLTLLANKKIPNIKLYTFAVMVERFIAIDDDTIRARGFIT